MGSTIASSAARLRVLTSSLPNLARALTLVREAAGRWTTGWLILLIAQGLLPIAVVYLTRELVDSLVAVAGSNASWQDARTPILLALAMAGLLVAGEIIVALLRWVRQAQAEHVTDHVRNLIQEQAARLDLAFYESADYYDRLHRAREDAQNRPAQLIENLGTLLRSTLTFVAMLGVLFTFAWWLPLVLVLSTAPALYVVVRYVLVRNEWRLRTTTDQRRARYYEELLTTREASPEMRLFDLGNHFRELFAALRTRLRTEQLDIAAGQARAQILAGLIAIVALIGSLLWMVLRSIRGAASLGDLAMFYQAFYQGQRLTRTLLETVGQIYANSLFLDNLFEFLALEPSLAEPDNPQPLSPTKPAAVHFRNVHFAYPGSRRPVFTGFNLEVASGELVALVGRNGAGKSTLFKLLCRFYDPSEGVVELAGTDLRNVASEDLRRRIAVLFQEPIHYSATVAENIAYGSLGAAASDPEGTERAANAAGAHELVQTLPDGYVTELGRWFGGTELSVGEWQRIALARAFIRDADVVLLDEPTSAMDAWQEADWMARFRDLVAGRTAIVITHRLTTACHADRIHVMDRGAIVESGTHSQLLTTNGPYQQAWTAQMRATE